MATTYDHIAGQSVERLAALSDGIFGVAMTLLLLDLHTPAKEIIHSEGDLVGALWGLAPNLLVYLMSFLTLGIYWVGQQTQLNYLIRSDRHLTWIHLAFLFAVTIMPFSTRLLADYIEYRTALIAYWFNIFVLGATLYAAWKRANCSNLIEPETPAEVRGAVCSRIVRGQTYYAIAAALCFFNTYVSIGCIILIQLNYVIAPRFHARGKP